MKRIILFLALCLILAQPAAAFKLEELLPDLISKGFDRILESQADNLYNMIGVNNSNAQPAVSTLMAQKNDFLSNPMVQKQKNFTSFWYFVFYIIFLLAGGIGVMKESASFDTMGNAFGSWRNKYFEIAIIAPLVWAFYLYGLQWIFSLESILAKSAFLESMNFVSYSPDNSMAYLLRALSFVSLMIIFYFRYLVVGIISAYFLLFAAAAIFPVDKIVCNDNFHVWSSYAVFTVPHVPDIAWGNRIDEWIAIPAESITVALLRDHAGRTAWQD